MLTDGRTDGRTTDGRTMDGRTTDAGVTGILIAHLGAFGSGELKNGIHEKFLLHTIPIAKNSDPQGLKKVSVQ